MIYKASLVSFFVIKVDQRVCITRQDHYYSITLDYIKFEAFCHLVLRELAVTLLACKSLCYHQHHSLLRLRRT